MGTPLGQWQSADLRFVLQRFEAMGPPPNGEPEHRLLESIRDELTSRVDACLDCGAATSGESCIRARCLVCELDKAVAQPEPDDGGEQQCPRCFKLAKLAGVAANGDAVCLACLDEDVDRTARAQQ